MTKPWLWTEQPLCTTTNPTSIPTQEDLNYFYDICIPAYENEFAQEYEALGLIREDKRNRKRSLNKEEIYWMGEES